MSKEKTKSQKPSIRARFKAYREGLDDAGKQRLITYLAYLGVVALAVLSSSLSLLFDIENFDAVRFATGVCFNIAFSLIALILSIKDGRLGNDTKKAGELFETKKEFKQTVDQIIDDDSFRQWTDYDYEKERKDYVMSELNKISIYDFQYLVIPEATLEKLKSEPLDNITYRKSRKTNEIDTCSLDQITEYQYQVIKLFREGKFTFRKLKHDFFKSQDGRNDYKHFGDIQDQDTKATFFAFFYRIMMIVIFSGIMALAVVNPNKSPVEQIAFDILSRIFNVCVSIFFGYSLAHDEARRMIDSLCFKITKIKSYLVDISTGIFVPKGRDEIIKEKIEEIRRNKTRNNNGTDKQPTEEQKPLETAETEQKSETDEPIPIPIEETPAQDEEELVIDPEDYEFIKTVLKVRHEDKNKKGQN